MTFAQSLTYLMEQHEVTNYRLAADIGVSQTSVANWKSLDEEKQRLPHPKTQQKIADYFNIDVQDFFGDALPPIRQQKKPAPNGDGRKELTHENYKISYREMPTTELYAMLSDITNELRERSEKEGN